MSRICRRNSFAHRKGTTFGERVPVQPAGDESERELKTTPKGTHSTLPNVSTATSWNGEKEAGLQEWSEKFTTYMAAAEDRTLEGHQGESPGTERRCSSGRT